MSYIFGFLVETGQISTPCTLISITLTDEVTDFYDQCNFKCIARKWANSPCESFDVVDNVCRIVPYDSACTFSGSGAHYKTALYLDANPPTPSPTTTSPTTSPTILSQTTASPATCDSVLPYQISIGIVSFLLVLLFLVRFPKRSGYRISNEV